MLKQLIRNIVPDSIYSFASGCKQPFSLYLSHKSMVKKYEEKQTNERMRIVFIVQRTEVFNSVRSICESASKDANCDVYFLPIPRYSIETSELRLETYESIYDFCQRLQLGKVIESLNKKSGQFMDLYSIHPDYIFLNTPYTETYPPEYHIERLKEIGKVCYVPYAYILFNEYRYKELLQFSFGLELIKYTYFIFADGKVTYNFLKRQLRFSEKMLGNRVFDLGFPRFDAIDLDGGNNGGFSTVLWLPRWTSDKEGDINLKSSFLEYKDKIVEYFGYNKTECQLIVRPHPSMFENYVRDGVMSDNEIEEFYSLVDSFKNIHLDRNADYMDSLKHADIVIADYSSVLIECFLKNIPVIYNGEKIDFSPNETQIISTFYYSSNWDEVKKILEDLLSGKDSLKEKRSYAVNTIKYNMKQAGSCIYDLLYQDYQFNKMNQFL